MFALHVYKRMDASVCVCVYVCVKENVSTTIFDSQPSIFDSQPSICVCFVHVFKLNYCWNIDERTLLGTLDGLSKREQAEQACNL